MDRETQLSHLEQADRHVAEGERLIVEQEARVVELHRDGHDTTEAWNLLAVFYESQAQHVEHRARIRKELDRKT